MPTDSVEFHEEANAEYDAAFDWYLEQSPASYADQSNYC